MNSSLWWQYAVVAVLVSVSLVYMFRKLAPQLATRWQAAASASLAQPRRMSAVQALGRWLRPRQATGNCGDNCGTCGSCGTSKRAAAGLDVQPLEFRPRQ